MATLPPGTPVDLTEYASEVLRFPPPDGDLVIVVHPAALRASSSPHTQVAQFDGGALTWLGALSEELLVTLDADPDPGARAACAKHFLRGARLWEVVRPGGLFVADAQREPTWEPTTVYGGSALRPWIVVGETDAGNIIAAPLNDASHPKWWTPVVPRTALAFPGNVKDAQVELAHFWSLPAAIASVGTVLPIGRGALEKAIEAYVTD